MLVIGGLLVGIGVGMMMGNTGAGTLIGLGLGFILEYFGTRLGLFRFGKGAPKGPQD